MPRVSKKDEKIDLAIKDTKLHLDNANLRLQLLQEEIRVLQDRLDTLGIIKNQK